MNQCRTHDSFLRLGDALRQFQITVSKFKIEESLREFLYVILLQVEKPVEELMLGRTLKDNPAKLMWLDE